MLHDAVWDEVSNFLGKNVTKVYGSMLLALRGGWVVVDFSGKKTFRNTRMAPRRLSVYYLTTYFEASTER